MTNVSLLARELSVSRTTARRILESMLADNIVARDGASEYRPARNIVEQDYFPEIETLSTGEHVETGFLDWILKRKIGLGSNVNEARLAIELGISNTSVREFLIRLSTFGFIRKEPHRQWVLNGFSEQYASELLHTRRLFEPDGAAKLADNSDDPVQREKLLELKAKHIYLLNNLGDELNKTPSLDSEFHYTINSLAGNQLIISLLNAISPVFHYHYHVMWDSEKRTGMALSALNDHVEIIDAIINGDRKAARKRMNVHLRNAMNAISKTF